MIPMTKLADIKKSTYSVIAILAFVIATFSACNNAKQVAYFQDVPDSANVEKRVPQTVFREPVIHNGDILYIEVSTIDTRIMGITTTEQQGEEGSQKKTITGYSVDKDGDVELPIIGKLHVVGLTTSQIKEIVRKGALKYYKDPIVNVRIANFSITILGEVKRPGRYIVENDKVSIIDALGLAGDLSLGGKRHNVMIIREENGQSVFTRVDLNSTDLLQSKYYYLQSGDKLYIEPLKSFARAGTANQRIDRFIGLSLGVVSVAVAIASLVLRNQ